MNQPHKPDGLTPADWRDVLAYTAPGGNRMAAIGMLSMAVSVQDWQTVIAIAELLHRGGTKIPTNIPATS